jgi:hypothetical protein
LAFTQRQRDQECPAVEIGLQVLGLWREHDQIEATQNPKEDFQDQMMREIFETTEAVKIVAATKGTVSLDGALFQFGFPSGSRYLRTELISDFRSPGQRR